MIFDPQKLQRAIQRLSKYSISWPARAQDDFDMILQHRKTLIEDAEEAAKDRARVLRYFEFIKLAKHLQEVAKEWEDANHSDRAWDKVQSVQSQLLDAAMKID